MTNDNATLVALIGRPNVGKSTLFNRMVKRRDALVDPTPGVTRDRHYARVSWEEHPFILVDTGGIDDEDDTITNHIRHQALLAIEEADVIFFLMDGREGLTPSDIEIVDLLRRTEKKVFFIVNKIDSPEIEDALLAPFWELGVDQLWALSGDHGYGYQTLMEGLLPYLEKTDLQTELPDNTMRIAFLGRPNVGKSSMVNAIIGQERMVVSDIAGTTRDSVDTLVTRDPYTYLLIDTAGIRRKGKTTDKLEKFSVLKALKALGRCDIALVLIDAEEGITEQDTKVIGYTQDQGRALIVLINKWDLIKDDKKRQEQLMQEVEIAIKFIPFAPVLKVSALTGTGIKRLFPEIGKVHRQFHQRFPTAALNRLLADAVARHEPPYYHGRRLKFYYTAQLGTAPPLFAVVASDPKGIHFSYQRYLTNCFREGLGLDKVPVRLLFRERSGRKK
ncbi:ribosome-associated GTPase EngA [Desulfobulbus propionicus DSM 2032]|uniref:GTPase Der n=1 Tax=Desulfobulbus propionicus (strain ATCC 33891 / DSM 2032 / VKM B-1956 / 1pr3) TaxID=577650 RepID=A0A7U4DNQ9_DESPD|nr:ribosome biogenesis GTPase Der [Desulfobulbus propionicus]ADW17202.1 ribosome-associated GTPase EngA [Desulfobulbus propionicus DSM 2032]